MEFRVWTELIQQSRGALHVFLPLLDRGLDAVIHRLTDGEYIPVQVKSRSEAINGFVEIGIPASELVDDRALIIAGLLADEGLGPKLLVVDEGTFKRLASCSAVKGEDVYSASFSMESPTSHWRPYLVQRERLAERLMGAPLPASWLESQADLGLEAIDRYSHWLGFLGEAEVVRRLAENADLDLFRPFPDLEMVEVLARSHVTGRFLGLQVKTAVPAEQYGEARIYIRKATFEPAASTSLVALAWLAEQRRFADECLLVPTKRLIEIAVDYGAHWVLDFHPHSQERGRLDPYRRPLSTLGQVAEDSSV
jgi:hypothetical protein